MNIIYAQERFLEIPVANASFRSSHIKCMSQIKTFDWLHMAERTKRVEYNLHNSDS